MHMRGGDNETHNLLTVYFSVLLYYSAIPGLYGLEMCLQSTKVLRLRTWHSLSLRLVKETT